LPSRIISWRIAFFAYFLVLAVIGFWPSPVDKPIAGTLTELLDFLHSRGIPEWFSYTFVEASANVFLFLPVGVLAALAFPARAWWLNVGVGLLVSLCLELGQMVFLADRFPSWVDVLTNTAGTAIGVLTMATVRRSSFNG
jgi:glycopeptide antibiotics resistance protein